MENYLDLDRKANYKIEGVRKEDYLTYWVAVVASKRNKNGT